MRINPNLFDHKGRLRLGSGYPTCVKWHPLYAQDEGYHYVAAGYRTGEIRMFHVQEDGKDGKPRLSLVHIFITDIPSGCWSLDWSPEGQYLVCARYDTASVEGAQKLVDAGFKTVYRLSGNFQAWKAAGYEVEIWVPTFEE